MKGKEGHSVTVSELVVKVYESHSVGPYTKETNLPSRAPRRHGVRMKAHEGKIVVVEGAEGLNLGIWWEGKGFPCVLLLLAFTFCGF